MLSWIDAPTTDARKAPTLPPSSKSNVGSGRAFGALELLCETSTLPLPAALTDIDDIVSSRSLFGTSSRHARCMASSRRAPVSIGAERSRKARLFL